MKTHAHTKTGGANRETNHERHFGSSICCVLVPLQDITTKVSFNVSARYCSFAKSKRNNNKLTRTNTHRSTLHSIFKLFGGFARKSQQLGNYLYESMSSLSTCSDNR